MLYGFKIKNPEKNKMKLSILFHSILGFSNHQKSAYYPQIYSMLIYLAQP